MSISRTLESDLSKEDLKRIETLSEEILSILGVVGKVDLSNIKDKFSHVKGSIYNYRKYTTVSLDIYAEFEENQDESNI